MGLVATWLTGCGLSHAIPNFTAAGIVTPTALAELDLAHYEALGLSTPEDRRKMFYLVQRVKLAVDHEKKEVTSSTTATSLEAQMDALVQSTTTSLPLEVPASAAAVNPINKENEGSTSTRIGEIKDEQQPHGEATRQERQFSRNSAPVAAQQSKPSPKAVVAKNSSPSKIPAPSPKRSNVSPSSTSTRSLSASSNNQLGNTAPGETTTPTKSPRSPTGSLKNYGRKDSTCSELDGSSTCDDGEEDEGADDEASIAVHTTVRRSKRISEKGKPGPSTSGSAYNPSTKKFVGASGLKTPLPKSKAKSSLPRPSSSRRTESKLQNPSKSMRTGKQLSTIPADSIAPMSPLTTMPPPQLEAHEAQLMMRSVVGKAKDAISGRIVKPKSRRSVSGSLSDSSSSASVGGRPRSRGRRKSFQAKHVQGGSSGNVSDSDSSASRNRRRTVGRVQGPKANITASNSSATGTDTAQGSVNRVPYPSVTQPKSNATAAKAKSAENKPFIHGKGASDSSWKAQIDALRQEVTLEHELFSEDVFHDDDDAGNDTIQVIVRKRPFNDDKPSHVDCIQPLDYGSYGKMLVYQPTTRVDLTKEITKVSFAFDGAYGEEYNNLQVYNKAVRPLIPVVLGGQHSTIFAFGCTGSGKTHTMLGSNFTGKKVIEEENMGLYYMAALDIFQSLEALEHSHLSVGASLFEIYGGKLYDLLNERKIVKVRQLVLTKREHAG
jgi:Kinesin motor domain